MENLKEIIARHGLTAKKSLGQNFLFDSNITDKIVSLSLEKQALKDLSQSFVFEIGSGPTGLTRSVLKKNPQKLTLVEMDSRCIAIAEELKQQTGANIEIINQDALKTDLSQMERSPRHIFGNLPYNISVPLLIGWLKNIESFDSLTLMFQKEVAERIMAPTKTKDYGRISILSQLLCQTDKLFDISPESFIPAPKIWSTVLLFRPLHADISAKDIENIEKLTAMAFGQRRKMIRSSLKNIPNLEGLCQKIGIKTDSRAEELTPAQFLSLAKLI